MKLNELLRNGQLHLTQLEKQALNVIRNQGSFYEVGIQLHVNHFSHQGNSSVERVCAEQLVKKGVLSTDIDMDGMTAYYINYELEFDPNDSYKIIFEEEEQ